MNYTEIKFNIDDENFFNFEFEAPKSLNNHPKDDFWFKFAHPIYNKYIPGKKYPIIRCRISQSLDNKKDLKIKFTNRKNQYREFLKFIVGKKEGNKYQYFDSTIKK